MAKRAYITLGIWVLILFSLCNSSMQCQKRPINHVLADSPSSFESPQTQKSSVKIILSILFGILTGLIFALLFAFIVRFFICYISKTPILKGPVVFSPKIAPKTLESALSTQTQLLGSSPNGNYYKTVLDNGLIIAVKRLEPFENGSQKPLTKSVKRRMQLELQMLASLRHRNLMNLRAFVRESDRISLVYDYMANGSLEDAMKRVRENELEMRWEIRLRIAVGITKGLQHLHFACVPRVFHHGLKLTNVMLDNEFEPRLADCGLAKVMPSYDRATMAGYCAPECFHDGRYTDKSDIFSFGIILAVLLTGKDPTDLFFAESASGGSLGNWLRHLEQTGDARVALDTRIIGEEVEEDEMLMAVRIAVVCISDLPPDRPSSDELVSMLTQLHSF